MWDAHKVLGVLCELSTCRWLWVDQLSQDQAAPIREKTLLHLPQYYMYKLTTVVMLLPTIECNALEWITNWLYQHNPKSDDALKLDMLGSHLRKCSKCASHVEFCIERVWTWQEYIMSSVVISIPFLGKRCYHHSMPRLRVKRLFQYFDSITRWSSYKSQVRLQSYWLRMPLLHAFLLGDCVQKPFKKLQPEFVQPLLLDISALRLRAEYEQDLLYAAFALVQGVHLPSYRSYSWSFQSTMEEAGEAIAALNQTKFIAQSAGPCTTKYLRPALQYMDSSFIGQIAGGSYAAQMTPMGLSMKFVSKEATALRWHNQTFECRPARPWFGIPAPELDAPEALLAWEMLSWETGECIAIDLARVDNSWATMESREMAMQWMACLMCYCTPNDFTADDSTTTEFTKGVLLTVDKFLVPALIQSEASFYRLFVSGDVVFVLDDDTRIVGRANVNPSIFSCATRSGFIQEPIPKKSCLLQSSTHDNPQISRNPAWTSYVFFHRRRICSRARILLFGLLLVTFPRGVQSQLNWDVAAPTIPGFLALVMASLGFVRDSVYWTGLATGPAIPLLVLGVLPYQLACATGTGDNNGWSREFIDTNYVHHVCLTNPRIQLALEGNSEHPFERGFSVVITDVRAHADTIEFVGMVVILVGMCSAVTAILVLIETPTIFITVAACCFLVLFGQLHLGLPRSCSGVDNLIYIDPRPRQQIVQLLRVCACGSYSPDHTLHPKRPHWHTIWHWLVLVCNLYIATIVYVSLSQWGQITACAGIVADIVVLGCGRLLFRLSIRRELVRKRNCVTLMAWAYHHFGILPSLLPPHTMHISQKEERWIIASIQGNVTDTCAVILDEVEERRTFGQGRQERVWWQAHNDFARTDNRQVGEWTS